MEKHTPKRSKKKLALSAFTIILLLTFCLAILSNMPFMPKASFIGDTIIDGSGVKGATLPETLMAPILGFADAIDIGIFILILGGFLKIVNHTKSLEAGIQVLIKKLKGKELLLIPILMFIFSIGGTTYGMLEETVGFYAILAAAMVAAGMDTVVSSAIVLLGAGSGVLGSTVNPFAVGVAVSALPEGLAVNQGIIIAIGVVLWLTSYAISTLFVISYAKKVIKKKGSTILSLQEQRDMNKTYGASEALKKIEKLTGKQKITLILFALTFVVMIVGFIPWGDFGVHIFEKTGLITGTPLGEWYFYEGALWFLIMTIVIGAVNGLNEHKFVDLFIDGADDMVGVILIIAVARGTSILMTTTYLDNYIIFNAAKGLAHVPKFIFAPLNYILHVGLSVLVPSSSGLATLSSPIMGPLANTVGYSVETTLMEMVAANGLVNLFTPTCGAIMGGLELAKVDYTTWLKWSLKVILCIAVANIIVLTVAMCIL